MDYKAVIGLAIGAEPKTKPKLPCGRAEVLNV